MIIMIFINHLIITVIIIVIMIIMKLMIHTLMITSITSITALRFGITLNPRTRYAIDHVKQLWPRVRLQRAEADPEQSPRLALLTPSIPASLKR